MIEAKNLTRSFGDHVALNDVSFAIRPGETLCLLGANGAGKTTAINLFLGFLEPTSGAALVDGKEVHKDPDHARSVTAYIPEQVALYPELTGHENLDFFTRLSGKTVEEAELIASLERSGLQKEAIHQRASGYSKGMRQKVGIAIAIAKGARILLLDEPLSGLDPKAANEFCELVKTMRDQGMTTLMVTHDLFRAREVGNRLGIMKAGRLVETINADAVSVQGLEAMYLAHMHDAGEAAA